MCHALAFPVQREQAGQEVVPREVEVRRGLCLVAAESPGQGKMHAEQVSRAPQHADQVPSMALWCPLTRPGCLNRMDVSCGDAWPLQASGRGGTGVNHRDQAVCPGLPDLRSHSGTGQDQGMNANQRVAKDPSSVWLWVLSPGSGSGVPGLPRREAGKPRSSLPGCLKLAGYRMLQPGAIVNHRRRAPLPRGQVPIPEPGHAGFLHLV